MTLTVLSDHCCDVFCWESGIKSVYSWIKLLPEFFESHVSTATASSLLLFQWWICVTVPSRNYLYTRSLLTIFSSLSVIQKEAVDWILRNSHPRGMQSLTGQSSSRSWRRRCRFRDCLIHKAQFCACLLTDTRSMSTACRSCSAVRSQLLVRSPSPVIWWSRDTRLKGTGVVLHWISTTNVAKVPYLPGTDCVWQ